MKKIIAASLLMLFYMHISAQSIINGNIKDDNGSPLHYAFISSPQAAKAAYTDSLGNFSVSVKPGTSITVRYPGARDTTLNITGNDARLKLVVNGSASSSVAMGAKNTVSSQPVSSIVVQGDMSSMASGSAGAMPSMAHQKGNVHGNRYLFDTFVHGFIFNPANQVVQNFDYLFDYDKIGGGLLLTANNKGVTQINDSEIKTFTLYGPGDIPYTFQIVPSINKVLYTQVISVGNKYNIYKSTSTKFVKSDYVNNGISAHGNDYDEYVDDATYFVMDAQTKQLQKLSLKKKSLKENFSKDADKLDKFMGANSGNINDAYLIKLGDYLNN